MKSFKRKGDVFNMVKRLGKIPVSVKDSTGFIVNRLIVIYLLEALFLFDEGMSFSKIDDIVENKFGLPMGPFHLIDKVGIDTSLFIIESFSQKGIIKDKPSFLKDLKNLSSKKEVFYLYDKKKKRPNPKLSSLKRSSTSSNLSPEDVISRLVFLMFNEAKKLVSENVSSSREIDLSLILGMGWPPYTGGLMNFVEKKGLDQVRKSLSEWEKSYGARFKPSF